METGSENLFIISNPNEDKPNKKLSKVIGTDTDACSSSYVITDESTQDEFHNSLKGLQGGNSSERYHLTRDERDSILEIKNILPFGLEGQVVKIKEDNTNTPEAREPVEKGAFITTTGELEDAKAFYITQQEIFNTWFRFSSTGPGVPALPLETNSWTYEPVGDYIKSTQNTGSFVGFVSYDRLNKYRNKATLSSTVAGDNDWISLVIAFVEDPNDMVPNTAYGLNPANFNWPINTTDQFIPNQHTLSVLRGRNNNVYSYAIVYDYLRPEAQIIASSSDPWNTIANWAIGTTVDLEVVRDGDIITTRTTDFSDSPTGQGAIRFPLVVDLNSNPVLAKFKGPTRYGYGSFSQPGATFRDIETSNTSNEIYDLRNGDVWVANSSGVYTIDPTRTVDSIFGVRVWWANKTTNKQGYIWSDKTFSVFGGGGSGTTQDLQSVLDEGNNANVPIEIEDGTDKTIIDASFIQIQAQKAVNIGNNYTSQYVLGTGGGFEFSTGFNNLGGTRFELDGTGNLRVKVGKRFDVLGTYQGLIFDTDDSIKFSDDLNNTGILYKADYSAIGVLNDRWIPDVGAVKALISGGAIPNLQSVLNAGNISDIEITITDPGYTTNIYAGTVEVTNSTTGGFLSMGSNANPTFQYSPGIFGEEGGIRFLNPTGATTYGMQIGKGFSLINNFTGLSLSTNNQFSVVDEVNSKGLKYAANYDTNGLLDDNWIPSLRSVKSLITNATSITYSNGLTKTLNDVSLGGNLSNPGVTINTNGQVFTVRNNAGAGPVLNLDSTSASQIGYRNAGGANIQSLTMHPTTGMQITDVANTKGLVYNGNYDTNGILDDNWLPSWRAVKSITTTASNGLTKSLNNITLGGAVTADFTIGTFTSANKGYIAFDVDPTNNSIDICTFGVGNINSRVFVDTTNTVISSRNNALAVSGITIPNSGTTGIMVADAVGLKGMSYTINYAANNTANPRWITDKGYVDSALALKANVDGGNTFTGIQNINDRVLMTPPDGAPSAATNPPTLQSAFTVNAYYGAPSTKTTGTAFGGNVNGIIIRSGHGGQSLTSSGARFGGTGGSTEIIAGDGGSAGIGGTAGSAGNAIVQGGSIPAGSGSTPGTSGAVILKGGLTALSNGAGGSIYLYPGWGNNLGGSTTPNLTWDGNIFLGTNLNSNQAGAIIIGSDFSDLTNRFQVTGNSLFTGKVKVTSAPVDPTDIVRLQDTTNFISNSADVFGTKISQIVSLTQAEYDGISTPSTTTFYAIIP